MRTRVKAKARPRKGHPYAFKDYNDDCVIHQSMVGFLHDIWKGAPKPSFFFVATTDPDGNHWREHIVRANDVTVGLNRFLNAHSRWDFNLYFCPNPFSVDQRKTDFALPTRLAWCDIDDSDPSAYEPKPNHLWETSPGRFQGLWLWDKRHNVEEAERFSRSLADRHGGDNGWTITKMLRVPGSINHKPKYDEPFVKLASRNWNCVSERPEPTPDNGRTYQHAYQSLVMDHLAFAPLEVLKNHWAKLNASTRSLIRHKQVQADNRSNRIFALIAGLYEANATLDEIASVVWNSPYFRDKYGDDLSALETEVSRIIAKKEGAK